MEPGEVVIIAFLAGEMAEVRNDRTDGYALYLHDNPIAWKAADGLRITLAGYNTRLTRKRLNGLLKRSGSHYRVSQRARQPHIEGRGERAQIEPDSIIEIRRGKRPVIKGGHRGMWVSVEKPSSKE